MQAFNCGDTVSALGFGTGQIVRVENDPELGPLYVVAFADGEIGMLAEDLQLVLGKRKQP